jgi:multidrug efflux pump subunit AcrA (membrane-fusion protein)
MKNSNLKRNLSTAATLLACAVFLHPASADEESKPKPKLGDDPNIGIKYDKKQGLFVTPFSAKLLGFEMADVEEREISGKLTLQAQIFDISPAGKALASAWIPIEDAEKLTAGMPVTLDRDFRGKVTSVASKLNEQAEVLLEIEDKEGKLKAGKFLKGDIVISSDGEVVVVPRSAVVNSSEGTFAYVDNAGWTTRAVIELGLEQDGMVEVVDGLYSGDVIVTTPVMTLWMTELQLLKSGRA